MPDINQAIDDIKSIAETVKDISNNGQEFINNINNVNSNISTDNTNDDSNQTILSPTDIVKVKETSKKILYIITGLLIFSIIAYIVAKIAFGVDLINLLSFTAPTFVTVNGGYQLKAFNENKIKYSQPDNNSNNQ